MTVRKKIINRIKIFDNLEEEEEGREGEEGREERKRKDEGDGEEQFIHTPPSSSILF